MQLSRELRRIAIIGAGSAGRDLGFRCVRAGFCVTLEDVMPSRLRNAKQMLASESTSAALHLVSTVEDAVRNADLAVDFVPDELESKLEIFSMLDRMAPPHTILCTPSSAVSIADLASCTYRPELCFALRLPDLDTAQIIYTSRSSPEALSAVRQWLAAIGFTVTTQRDPTQS